MSAASEGRRDNRATPALSCSVLATVDELEAMVAEWDVLASTALEPSPDAESWGLLPALRHLAVGSDVRVLTVRAHYPEPPGSAARLCAVFPLEIRRRYRGLPLPVLRIWNHAYTLFPAPLLDAGLAAACLREFFHWARAEWPASTLIEFPELRADSAFFRLLAEVLRADDLSSQVVDLHTRAFFRPRHDVDAYLNAIGTAHHRHELRRQERRLSDMGRLDYDRVAAGADVGGWLDEFIGLELQGWKGKEGTAFGSRPGHRAYLHEIVAGGTARGRTMLLGLRLDDRPLALKLNFVGGDGGYTFKIAFDEGYSKFSPGTLLELENIRQAHADPAINWLDSLALPDHAMMNRVWLDRTPIVSQVVAPGRLAGELALASLPLLRAARRRLRRGS